MPAIVHDGRTASSSCGTFVRFISNVHEAVVQYGEVSATTTAPAAFLMASRSAAFGYTLAPLSVPAICRTPAFTRAHACRLPFAGTPLLNAIPTKMPHCQGTLAGGLLDGDLAGDVDGAGDFGADDVGAGDDGAGLVGFDPGDEVFGVGWPGAGVVTGTGLAPPGRVPEVPEGCVPLAPGAVVAPPGSVAPRPALGPVPPLRRSEALAGPALPDSSAYVIPPAIAATNTTTATTTCGSRLPRRRGGTGGMPGGS